MGNWALIAPEATENLLADPEFGLAEPDTIWDFGGDGTTPDFGRITTDQWFGAGCAVADLDGGTYATIYQAVTVAATAHILSARVKRSGGGVVGASQVAAVWDSGQSAWDSIEILEDGWYLCTKTGTPTAGSRQFGVRALEDGLRVDGIQLEAKSYRTTFCSGERPGCAWRGLPHRSASWRSEHSRDGGRVISLDDYDVHVQMSQGIGMPPVKVHRRGFALLPGSFYLGTKLLDRTISLVLWTDSDDLENLHAIRQALILALRPGGLDTARTYRLRYSGAAGMREIGVRYAGGLEFKGERGRVERFPLQLVAEDPLWYSVRDVAVALDTNDTLTARGVIGRINGAWSALGPPSAGGTVYALVVGPDGALYVGGDFTNWNGIANADYVAAWDGSAWSALGTGTNGAVRALAFDAAGNLYVGGDFTLAGGVASTAYIAAWDGSSWSALGTGTNGIVRALTVGLEGTLYAGGDFTLAGGVASTAYIAAWDGSSWSALGTGLNNVVRALAVGLDGVIYAGGDFLDAGGDWSADYIAQWDGSDWAACASVGFFAPRPNDVIRALVRAVNGDIYAAGDFTTPAPRIARWNGAGWSGLAQGIGDASVYALVVGPDGAMCVGGDFTEVNDESVIHPLAKWTGSDWVPLDCDLSGISGVEVYALAVGAADPIVGNNYALYVGGVMSGSVVVAGTTSVESAGTADAYPQIIVSRSGGDGATLLSIRNETTGHVLVFNQAIQDGETLTVDLRPRLKSVDSSFYGRRLQKVLRASDFGAWRLLPGSNTISMLVLEDGSPTMTAYLVYQRPFLSAD